MLKTRWIALPALALIAASSTGAETESGENGTQYSAAEGRTAIQMRYVSDPTVPTIPPDFAFCANAPFAANAYVEGALTTYELHPSDGTVKLKDLEGKKQIGYARGCLQITDLTFTPFVSEVPIYWELEIDDVGVVKADGKCIPSNKGIPKPGVVLGGCVMRITQAPEGYIGGNVVESGVLFNPFGVEGVELSSSYFTVHLFSDPD